MEINFQLFRNFNYICALFFADVAELVDVPDLGSGALRRGGSSPFVRTRITNRTISEKPVNRIFFRKNIQISMEQTERRVLDSVLFQQKHVSCCQKKLTIIIT